MPNILNSKTSSSTTFTVDRGLLFENNKLSLAPPTLLFDINSDRKLREDPRQFSYLLVSILLGNVKRVETSICIIKINSSSPLLLKLNDVNIKLSTISNDTPLTSISLAGVTTGSIKTGWVLNSVYGIH